MSVAVFTPTYRPGGLDVLTSSLSRQTYRDFTWIVVDELYHSRAGLWDSISEGLSNDVVNITMPPKTKHRNLCEAYNAAAKLVLIDGSFDLFISLQDYIYVPPGGIERFVNIHERRQTILLLA